MTSPRSSSLRAEPRLATSHGEAEAHRTLSALSEERERYVSFVRRKVRSGADAEDLVQQAMVRAAERVHTLVSPEKRQAWFYRILRNTLADHHAQWALREKKLHELALEAAEATPEEVASCACSLGLMARLNPDYREMLTRIDIDEESIGEIARERGLTENNVSVKLHRARKSLRDELLTFCGVTSAKECADCGCDA